MSINVQRKKLLVCEFITAGGLAEQELSESLAKEGALMRDALLKDLAQLQQYEIHTLHDVRLEVSEHVMHSLPVVPGSFRQVFTEALKKVDFVWLIAPETSGTMLELSEICYEAEARENGPVFIGSGFDTMLTGTSKTLCFEALTAANIHTLPVYAGEDLIQDAFFEGDCDDYVVKPFQREAVTQMLQRHKLI